MLPAIHISNIRLASRQSKRKWAKDMNRCLAKEDVHVAKKRKHSSFSEIQLNHPM
jgi:hypothetical protein